MSRDQSVTLPSAAQRRQTRLARVRLLRIGLPALAGLLVLLVAGQIVWGLVNGLLHPPIAAVDQTVRMSKPMFSGQGRDGSRFTLTALSGVRDPHDDKRILLDHPHITVSRVGQSDTNTISENGVFQEDAHTLRLTGNVEVEEAGSYQFATNDATIDTTTGQVVGSAVKGASQTAAVQSNSYAVTNKGDRMVFKGRVRARLNEH